MAARIGAATWLASRAAEPMRESDRPDAAPHAERPGAVRFRTMKSLAWLGLAVAMLASLLASAPATGGLIPTPWDKLVHVGFFGALAFALGMGLGRRGIPLAFLGAVAAGMIDEGYQSFLPGRTSDWTDLLADVLGAALAVLLLRRILRPKAIPAPSRQG